MVKSHLTLRCVIYRSFGNQPKTFMVDHVTQGFKGVTGWVDNQTVTVIHHCNVQRCMTVTV